MSTKRALVWARLNPEFAILIGLFIGGCILWARTYYIQNKDNPNNILGRALINTSRSNVKN